MNMIDIKTSKAPAEPTDGRSRYEFEGPKTNSATPFYAGFMLTALLLYFKSATMQGAKASQAPDRGEPETDPELLPNDGSDLTSLALWEPEADIAQALRDNWMEKHVAPKMVYRTGSVVPEDFVGKYQFGESDRLNLDFEETEGRGMFSFGTAVSFQVLPNNDNRTGSATAGEGDTGGGGTGGGPTDGGPDEDDDDLPVYTPANRKPVVDRSVVLFDQFVCTAIVIAMTDLLRDARDPDGDLLTVKDATVSSGELHLVNGGYSYHGEEVGPVTITYKIFDGKEWISQTASFDLVKNPVIYGTEGDDTLVGTECDDEIDALGGNDKVQGLGGDDIINGGSGDDEIHGGDGDDVLDGGDGDDLIYGGLGNDFIIGGAGNDQLYGDGGDDMLLGGEGYDQLYGGEGADILDGGEGHDQLYGGIGADHFYGDSGNDMIAGAFDGSSDITDGGDGFDTLDYGSAQTAIVFDLPEGTATSGGESDLFAKMESFVGGSGDDTFSAVVGQEGPSSLAQTIEYLHHVTEVMHEENSEIEDGPSSGIEIVETLTTADQSFIGGDGDDCLDYSEAQHSVVIDIAAGTATGLEIGRDHFEAVESFAGGCGDDIFLAAGGAVNYLVVSGDDHDAASHGVDCDCNTGAIEFYSTAAPDSEAVQNIADDQSFNGHDGDDILSYAGAQDDLVIDIENGVATGAEIGTDRFSDVECIIGGEGDDTFIIGEGLISLDGRGGNDLFVFATDVGVDNSGNGNGSDSHQIRNFEVGDIVRMSSYDIFERALDDLTDSLADQMGGGADDTSFADAMIPIRIRHETYEDLQQTYLEADFDRDDYYEISVQLDGLHDLIIINNQAG
jgi:Ca2+-binding RTX toxin-like protein